MSDSNPLTADDVRRCQEAWGKAILEISETHGNGGDYLAAARAAAAALYGYGHGDVLFKPTKAREQPWRPTADDALSYFYSPAH